MLTIFSLQFIASHRFDNGFSCISFSTLDGHTGLRLGFGPPEIHPQDNFGTLSLALQFLINCLLIYEIFRHSRDIYIDFLIDRSPL